MLNPTTRCLCLHPCGSQRATEPQPGRGDPGNCSSDGERAHGSGQGAERQAIRTDVVVLGGADPEAEHPSYGDDRHVERRGGDGRLRRTSLRDPARIPRLRR